MISILLKRLNFDLKRAGHEMTSLFPSFIFPPLLLLLTLNSPHCSPPSLSPLYLLVFFSLLLFLIPIQEQEALQQAEQRCAHLVQARCQLETQVAQLELRVEQEEEANAQLSLQRHTLQAECCSLRQDLQELESTLSTVEKDKQVMHTCTDRTLEYHDLVQFALIIFTKVTAN